MGGAPWGWLSAAVLAVALGARWLAFAPWGWPGLGISQADGPAAPAPRCAAPHISAGLPREGSSYFFSIGDFGVAGCESAHARGEVEKKGGPGHRLCSRAVQAGVAREMERLAAGLRPSFVLSLGDNFYARGVKDLEDTQFRESFEDIYGFGALAELPWHIALGDHDHRGNVTAKILHSERSRRWSLPSAYYGFEAPAGPEGDGVIEFLVTDSVGLEGAANATGSGERRFAAEYAEEHAGREAGERQWRWLEATLHGAREAGAKLPALQVVVGHRPVISAVMRDRTEHDALTSWRLKENLAMARVRNPVIYLSGHDHAFQHLKEHANGVDFVGNGLGGFVLHPLAKRSQSPGQLKWAASHAHGFVVHEVDATSMTLHFVDADAKVVLHSVRVPLGSA